MDGTNRRDQCIGHCARNQHGRRQLAQGALQARSICRPSLERRQRSETRLDDRPDHVSSSGQSNPSPRRPWRVPSRIAAIGYSLLGAVHIGTGVPGFEPAFHDSHPEIEGSGFGAVLRELAREAFAGSLCTIEGLGDGQAPRSIAYLLLEADHVIEDSLVLRGRNISGLGSIVGVRDREAAHADSSRQSTRSDLAQRPSTFAGHGRSHHHYRPGTRDVDVLPTRRTAHFDHDLLLTGDPVAVAVELRRVAGLPDPHSRIARSPCRLAAREGNRSLSAPDKVQEP
ncbi:hypothetical protein OHA_1_02579 [Pleomorphomonas sp. SM30]|uniref:Uncharacterized protein n=1 Tax=Oharaeibacter diazotrophicus TaxID=1920512 RepID=A0A4R6RCP5_9HYPH|nr:hypothetical protein EDD54_2534 [Oharaeibacter diazotrophicus]BBE72974.1 hypothetical protein OHA_1_02579 [Pleomorphomonas sp. SM30]